MFSTILSHGVISCSPALGNLKLSGSLTDNPGNLETIQATKQISKTLTLKNCSDPSVLEYTSHVIQNRTNPPDNLGGAGFVLIEQSIVQRALLVPKTEWEGGLLRKNVWG